MKHLAYLVLPLFLALAIIPLHAQQKETTIGGYGELHYNEPDGTRPGELDFHRFVIYLSHGFNDWITFFSEVELEHTFVSAGESRGEFSIEQAFLSFQPWENYGFQGGIILVPVGFINLVHEPPTFHGVERPTFHRVIVPTTWREAGAGFFGTPVEQLRFQVNYVAGLRASAFNAGNGIRDGRQKAIRSNVSDMAVTGRIDYMPVAGATLGGSFFAGNSTGGVDSLGSGATTILAFHGRYDIGNLQVRAEIATISISDAELINRAFNRSVADNMLGYYAEAAYNFLPHLAPETAQQMFLFRRYEFANTEADVTGFTATGVNERTEYTFGFTYKPDPNVAIKADYQIFQNAVTDSKSTYQFNAGFGYAF